VDAVLLAFVMLRFFRTKPRDRLWRT